MNLKLLIINQLKISIKRPIGKHDAMDKADWREKEKITMGETK